KTKKMEKLKFGIQLLVLMLAFPVLFFAEVKYPNKVAKPDQEKTVENSQAKQNDPNADKCAYCQVEMGTVPFSKHIVVN
ncbi:MAG: hypothetical protein KA409_10800, partial [Ferruginibacter sp.]|nr:hypothetical protein [Ferruginibacter sp.]